MRLSEGITQIVTVERLHDSRKENQMDIFERLAVWETTDCYTGEVIAMGEYHYERVNGDPVKKSTYEENPDKFIVCEECGKLIDKEEDEYYETAYCTTICEICREDNYYECEECGELHHNDDAVYVDDGDYYICQNCFDWSGYYYRCDVCGCVRSGEGTETHDGDTVCDDCIESYERCADCGEVWREDDMYYDGWDWYCPECDNGTIRGYHEHCRETLDRFNLAGKMDIPEYDIGNNKYTIGTETEVENNGSENSSRVAMELSEIMGERAYFEHDGSLAQGGFEMILKPHTVDAFKNCKEFKKALEVLQARGFTSHDNPNCGLHIHVSKWFFGDTDAEQKKNIAKVLYMYSQNFEFFKKLSRRQSTYWCQNVSFEDCSQALSEMWRATGHQVAVNTQNLPYFGTVEFRLGRGTLNYETYMAWVDIHTAIARNAKNIPENDVDLNKWLKGISMETRGYILRKSDVVINISRNRRVVA